MGVATAAEAGMEIGPQVERLLGQIVGLVIALGFGGFGLGCVWMGLRCLAGDLSTWRQAWASRNWATASGTITRSQVHVEGSGRRVRYTPDIAYDYQAGGQSYTGTRLGFASFGHAQVPEQIEERLRPYPTGAAATVYHDPARPAVATLDRRWPRGQVGGCVLTGVMWVGGAGLAAIGWLGLADVVRSVVGP